MAYQRGTGFVGLQQYLGANEEQAKQMGQRLVGQVNAEGQAAQGAIDAGVKTFNDAATAGTPTYGGLPDSQNLPGTADIYLQGKVAGSTYTGPKTLGNTEALAKGAAGAAQTAGLASTDAGRATMLAKQATGSYGLGQRSLDAALAGRGGGAELDAATAKYSKLQDYLGTAKTGAEARAAQGVTDAAGVAEQYRTTKTPTITYGPPSIDRVRNPIETPGTTKERGKNWLDSKLDKFGHWLRGD
jgi:hypothetical protein